jgi:hypothetical protein
LGVLCFVCFLVFSLLPASRTSAQDFSATYVDQAWDEEVFLTVGITSAAITFDSEDNLYLTDLLNDWDSGAKNVWRLDSPDYSGPYSLYASYTTGYDGISGLDFDDKGNLYVSEFMGSMSGSDDGAMRKIYAQTLEVSDPIEFVFRPTGVAATGKGTIYFPGRKWSEPNWGNLYMIESFDKYEANTEPTIVKPGAVWVSIAEDKWGYIFSGSRYPDNSVYARNPYTEDLVRIAQFNQYVEELAFDSEGNLYALESADDGDPSTIIKLISPKIVIDECNTGIIDWPFSDGTTIGEGIDECKTAYSHGEFVTCVVNYANELQKDGYISSQQMVAIITCAAKANLP